MLNMFKTSQGYVLNLNNGSGFERNLVFQSKRQRHNTPADIHKNKMYKITYNEWNTKHKNQNKQTNAVFQW